MISVVIGCVRGWGVWGDHPLAFGKSKMADMVGFGKKVSEEVWKWSNMVGVGWVNTWMTVVGVISYPRETG